MFSRRRERSHSEHRSRQRHQPARSHRSKQKGGRGRRNHSQRSHGSSLWSDDAASTTTQESYVSGGWAYPVWDGCRWVYVAATPTATPAPSSAGGSVRTHYTGPLGEMAPQPEMTFDPGVHYHPGQFTAAQHPQYPHPQYPHPQYPHAQYPHQQYPHPQYPPHPPHPEEAHPHPGHGRYPRWVNQVFEYMNSRREAPPPPPHHAPHTDPRMRRERPSVKITDETGEELPSLDRPDLIPPEDSRPGGPSDGRPRGRNPRDDLPPTPPEADRINRSHAAAAASRDPPLPTRAPHPRRPYHRPKKAADKSAGREPQVASEYMEVNEYETLRKSPKPGTRGVCSGRRSLLVILPVLSVLLIGGLAVGLALYFTQFAAQPSLVPDIFAGDKFNYSVSGEIRLGGLQFVDDYLDQSSVMYQNTESQFCQSMRDQFDRSLTMCDVMSFREGSVIVDFQMMLRSDNDIDEEDVVKQVSKNEWLKSKGMDVPTLSLEPATVPTSRTVTSTTMSSSSTLKPTSTTIVDVQQTTEDGLNDVTTSGPDTEDITTASTLLKTTIPASAASSTTPLISTAASLSTSTSQATMLPHSTEAITHSRLSSTKHSSTILSTTLSNTQTSIPQTSTSSYEITESTDKTPAHTPSPPSSTTSEVLLEDTTQVPIELTTQTSLEISTNTTQNYNVTSSGNDTDTTEVPVVTTAVPANTSEPFDFITTPDDTTQNTNQNQIETSTDIPQDPVTVTDSITQENMTYTTSEPNVTTTDHLKTASAQNSTSTIHNTTVGTHVTTTEEFENTYSHVYSTETPVESTSSSQQGIVTVDVDAITGTSTDGGRQPSSVAPPGGVECRHVGCSYCDRAGNPYYMRCVKSGRGSALIAQETGCPEGTLCLGSTTECYKNNPCLVPPA